MSSGVLAQVFFKHTDLVGIVAKYYNGECSYYDTLDAIVQWGFVTVDKDYDKIIAVDIAIDTLRNGYQRLTAGGRIEYDGQNFALLGKGVENDEKH